MPRELLEVHIAPVDKPGRNPQLRASERPISLIYVLMEIGEAAINNRFIYAIESTLRPSQYAYSRSRGCEMHLTMLTDFIAEQLLAGQFVYVASLDIDGAFDAASHDSLMPVLWETQAVRTL